MSMLSLGDALNVDLERGIYQQVRVSFRLCSCITRKAITPVFMILFNGIFCDLMCSCQVQQILQHNILLFFQQTSHIISFRSISCFRMFCFIPVSVFGSHVLRTRMTSDWSSVRSTTVRFDTTTSPMVPSGSPNTTAVRTNIPSST